MATTKKQPTKKPAAKPRAKKASAKKPELVDIQFLTNHPKVKELAKQPNFKQRFELVKEKIKAGYKFIESPPFCKPLIDKSTGLIVLLEVQPSDPKSIHRKPAAVFIKTMVGRLQYIEEAEFKNMQRACEYIADFDQKQAARFCASAVKRHAYDVTEMAMKEIMPLIDQTVNEAKEPTNLEKKEEKK